MVSVPQSEIRSSFTPCDPSTSNSWSAIIIRPPKGSGEDVDDDDDDGHAADGGVVLVAESIVLLTAGEPLDQQDARGDHLSKGGKKTKEYVFLHLFPVFIKTLSPEEEWRGTVGQQEEP